MPSAAHGVWGLPPGPPPPSLSSSGLTREAPAASAGDPAHGARSIPPAIPGGGTRNPNRPSAKKSVMAAIESRYCLKVSLSATESHRQHRMPPARHRSGVTSLWVSGTSGLQPGAATTTAFQPRGPRKRTASRCMGYSAGNAPCPHLRSFAFICGFHSSCADREGGTANERECRLLGGNPSASRSPRGGPLPTQSVMAAHRVSPLSQCILFRDGVSSATPEAARKSRGRQGVSLGDCYRRSGSTRPSQAQPCAGERESGRTASMSRKPSP